MKFLCVAGANTAPDIIIGVFLALLTLLSIGFLIAFLCRFVEDSTPVKHKFTALAVMFAVGFALRLVFALCVRGYRDDYAMFTSMIDRLEVNGLNGYYQGDASVVLYPIVYFIYLIFGSLSNAMGLSGYGLGIQFMIKLPMIIADILAAYAVYKIACKYFNERVALVLCAFVCVCPIFFIASCLWCTPIVFTVMFACFGCYFLARKKYAPTIAFMTAAAFCSKEGIYLFPVVCVFALFHFVRAARRLAQNHGEKLFPDNSAAVTVPVAFICSVLGAYLIGLFMTASYSYNIFKYIYEFLIEPLASWSYFTYNGLSVYTIFGQNGATPGARFPTWVFVCLFAAIITAVVCVVYFTKRNRATMVMLAAYSLVTMQIYYPGSSAIGFESALLILLAAYALVKDKRLLQILFMIGIAYLVNVVTALSSAGYMNNLDEYNFGTENTLLSGGMGAIGIVCSVLTLLAHLYFTVVAVNVGMTGQKKQLRAAEGFSASIKEFVALGREK